MIPYRSVVPADRVFQLGPSFSAPLPGALHSALHPEMVFRGPPPSECAGLLKSSLPTGTHVKLHQEDLSQTLTRPSVCASDRASDHTHSFWFFSRGPYLTSCPKMSPRLTTFSAAGSLSNAISSRTMDSGSSFCSFFALRNLQTQAIAISTSCHTFSSSLYKVASGAVAGRRSAGCVLSSVVRAA